MLRVYFIGLHCSKGLMKWFLVLKRCQMSPPRVGFWFGGEEVGGASVVVANHCLSAITKLIKDSVIAVMTTSRERERGVSTLDLLLYLSTLKVNDISIILKTQGQIL